ncbi:MAG: FkbM family methyltransferase, partial [Bacteroidota bacterium]
RFADKKNIEIVNGDSGKLIYSLLKDKIKETALFWLDGHYNSTEGLSSDEQICPIFAELDCIFNHPVKNHIILIDDARLFIGTNGYPTLEEVKKTTASKRPELLFYVEEDIIRIHQK